MIAPHPIYFGPPDRSLFGWLHRPEGLPSGARVLLCPPLGYEGLFAHPSLRYLAGELARAGATVLRPDYDGTADSAGSDRDPDRVESWLATIACGTQELLRLAPSDGPLALVGLRAGALLATCAAARLGGVDALVLWAPVVTGKAFVREQRAFAKMAVASAAEPQTGEAEDAGFEANGYYFSEKTASDLGQLDLRSLEPPARRTLIMWRDDIPRGLGDLAEWIANPRVHAAEATGYARMMEAPMSMSLPVEAVSTICDFMAGVGVSSKTDPSTPPRPVTDMGRVDRGVIERGAWYGGDGHRFGILTLPEAGGSDTAFILLNNAKGYRVGPHGMNPPLARRLARNGVVTLRVDLAGVGDSSLPEGRAEHHVYGLDAIDDVRAAVSYLLGRGLTRIFVGGLCSGAYLAWHAALEIPSLAGVILLNLQTFVWTEDQSLDVTPLDIQYASDHYRRSAKSPASWYKLLRGGVNVGYAARVFAKYIGLTVETLLHRAWTRVSTPKARSDIVERIQQLGARGTAVNFIYSGRDPGLTMLRKELGANWRTLISRSQVHVDLIDGSDHSFTPAWASERLTEAVEKALVLVKALARAGPESRR